MSTSAPDTKVSAASVKNTTPRSRVILASLVGTTIEFYDFYIYATAAVAVFPVLFFPARTQPPSFWLPSRPSASPSLPAPSVP